MNCRERILTALDGGYPDRVPVFELYINQSSLVNIAKSLALDVDKVESEKDRFGEEGTAILDLYCEIIQTLDLDATSTNFSMALEKIGENLARDKYGATMALSPHGEPLPVEGAVETMSDIRRFSMVDKLDKADFAGVKYVIDRVGHDRAHFVCIHDPFKLSWRYRGGMQKLLVDYMLNPGLAHGLADIATEFDMGAIDIAAGIGADAIIVPGDLASEHTTIMSPRHYREFIKPYHRMLVEHAHSRGLRIIKHSDGNVWPIVDDFLEVGFDGIHPVQPQSMDIGEVKQYVKGKACVLGNIDCRDLLPFGTPDEVKSEVRETIRKVGKEGYIISSSNSIHPGCKAENYIAMVEAAHEYGQ